jgi:hypothetical protein
VYVFGVAAGADIVRDDVQIDRRRRAFTGGAARGRR